MSASSTFNLTFFPRKTSELFKTEIQSGCMSISKKNRTLPLWQTSALPNDATHACTSSRIRVCVKRKKVPRFQPSFSFSVQKPLEK
eukprot:699468-Rhodomonas_salina.3